MTICDQDDDDDDGDNEMKGGGEYKSETGSQGILLREPTIASSYKHDHQTDSKDFDDGDHQVEADLHFPAF